MVNLFVLIGKSATGKDTIFKELLKELPMISPLTIYTTRPKRIGEVNGKEYYFVSEEEMNCFKNEELILEHRQYDTVNGVWHYFTANDFQFFADTDLMTINTIDGYLQLKENLKVGNIYPILIDVPDYLRLIRSISREKEQKNPNYNEVCRRYLGDELQFTQEKIAGIPVFYNLEKEACIKEIKAYINNIRKATE